MKTALMILIALHGSSREVWAADVQVPAVKPWLLLPFALLLLSIAVVPLIHRKWWHRYYPHVALGLGFLVFAYYVLNLHYHRMLETAVEYASFIALIGSLYVTASGIHISTDRHNTPLMNTLLLALGALLSNVIGTTGASILLIRPYIRLNKPHVRRYHIVFFIFCVSNMGGALTPIGDPPLFLGYLYGVPFLWTAAKLWPIWLAALAPVLAIFYVVDNIAGRRGPHGPAPSGRGRNLRIAGSQNLFFLVIILAAVFAATPAREIIMIAAAAAAWRFGKKEALRSNEFSFEPIREVAILFAGIFATMVPALDWLSLNARHIGIRSPGHFYWATGILSSFLDNAPTYLNFLSAALGLHDLRIANPADIRILIAEHGRYLQAISAGSVFFGAITYIGNGPNFMVKMIAEHAGVACPSFLEYMFRYSLPVLIPVFTLVWFLFFR